MDPYSSEDDIPVSDTDDVDSTPKGVDQAVFADAFSQLVSACEERQLTPVAELDIGASKLLLQARSDKETFAQFRGADLASLAEMVSQAETLEPPHDDIAISAIRLAPLVEQARARGFGLRLDADKQDGKLIWRLALRMRYAPEGAGEYSVFGVYRNKSGNLDKLIGQALKTLQQDDLKLATSGAVLEGPGLLESDTSADNPAGKQDSLQQQAAKSADAPESTDDVADSADTDEEESAAASGLTSSLEEDETFDAVVEELDEMVSQAITDHPHSEAALDPSTQEDLSPEDAQMVFDAEAPCDEDIALADAFVKLAAYCSEQEAALEALINIDSKKLRVRAQGKAHSIKKFKDSNFADLASNISQDLEPDAEHHQQTIEVISALGVGPLVRHCRERGFGLKLQGSLYKKEPRWRLSLRMRYAPEHESEVSEFLSNLNSTSQGLPGSMFGTIASKIITAQTEPTYGIFRSSSSNLDKLLTQALKATQADDETLAETGKNLDVQPNGDAGPWAEGAASWIGWGKGGGQQYDNDEDNAAVYGYKEYKIYVCPPDGYSKGEGLPYYNCDNETVSLTPIFCPDCGKAFEQIEAFEVN